MSKADLKLLIIQPSHYRSKTDRTIFKTRRRQMVPLALPYLAALTPREWTVTLLDEQLEDINFEVPVDVVALSAWTLHSPAHTTSPPSSAGAGSRSSWVVRMCSSMPRRRLNIAMQ